MSTEPKSSSHLPSAGQQRRQARVLLLRFQWLLILLLIIALLWLYVSQQRFQNQVNERLQSNEQMVTRLNEMDDRLFAISQQTMPVTNVKTDSQAQNQLDLLRIQIQVVDRLLVDNNYKAAINLLRGLQWQLSQNSNEIAPTLTTVIKQSLTEDIEQLQAQSAQPNSWQLQNIAIQNIQAFLRSYERIDSNKNKVNDGNKDSNRVALTRQQLMVHEVIMTLNLAIQASNMHEQDQLNAYLRQARAQLQTLPATTSTTKKSDSSVTIPDNKPRSNINTVKSPNNISGVIDGLDKLIANAPEPTSLLTAQVLDQPKS